MTSELKNSEINNEIYIAHKKILNAQAFMMCTLMYY